jgi:sortase A
VRFLFAFGFLTLGFCALAYFEAWFSQTYEQRSFEKNLRLPAPPPDAMSVSRLEIPRLGVSVMVHEGVAPRTLRLGAGHIPWTEAPGGQGNVGIAGHRDLFFRDLRKVRPEDTILLTTLEGSYQYSVEWTRVVKPTDGEVLAPSEDAVLTLVTCYPFYYVGTAPERFIVRARRVGQTR